MVSSPAIANLHELVFDPSTGASNGVLDFRLDGEHLVLGDALLPLDFGIRRYPLHLAFARRRGEEIGGAVTGEDFLPLLLLMRHHGSGPNTPTPTTTTTTQNATSRRLHSQKECVEDHMDIIEGDANWGGEGRG